MPTAAFAIATEFDLTRNGFVLVANGGRCKVTEYISREAAIMTAMNYDGNGNAQDASQDIAAALGCIPAAGDVRPVVKAKNIGTDYAECDQFVCSNCGVELQDWHRVERDDDDGDITYHEYVFRYCPNCGAYIGKDGIVI